MPAQSQQQQKLFGLALAFKRGEVPASEVSDEIKAIADRMSEKEIEDFASTKHKGLPKMKEQLRSIVREIMREKVISEMNEAVKIKMNNLDWGKSTAERNANLDKYDLLKTDKEREVFLRKLKGESVNEEQINEIGVLGVASGVALGLVGVIALSKGVNFAKRKFGEAMYNLTDKLEKKVKKIESDKAKKTIMDIAKKFENDKKLQDMYQALPKYKERGNNSQRQKGMAEIAKYVKSKLSSEEMQYFYDLNTYLRTGKIKGTLVASEKKTGFQNRLDKLRHDNEYTNNESVNEADVKKKINRRGDEDGLLVQHNGKEYHIVYSGDFGISSTVMPYGIVMPGDDTVSFLSKDRNAKTIWKQLKPKVDKFLKSNESVNEAEAYSEREITDQEPSKEAEKLRKSVGGKAYWSHNADVTNHGDYIIRYEMIKDGDAPYGLIILYYPPKQNKPYTSSKNGLFAIERWSDGKELYYGPDYRKAEAAIKKHAATMDESVNEGASTEEKRIVMMAIKKIAKYRNVPLNVAVVDTIRAAEELERTIKK